MLQRKLITVCSALLVFITTHAQMGPSRSYNCTLITNPAHYVKSHHPNVAHDATTTEQNAQNASATLAAGIYVENGVVDPYHIELVNLSTSVVYDFYLNPYQAQSATVPDGNYSVSFTPNGGLSGKHYFTAGSTTTYNYSAYYPSIYISNSTGLINIWDWP
jgi:hypothetical protein